VADIIRDFINHERQHMAMEERVVFPAALNALRAEDWEDIASRLTERDDPLYQAGFEKEFGKLRRSILQMEAEAEAERLTEPLQTTETTLSRS
jgi:hemerythrin-like domain-containing protein